MTWWNISADRLLHIWAKTAAKQEQRFGWSWLFHVACFNLVIIIIIITLIRVCSHLLTVTALSYHSTPDLFPLLTCCLVISVCFSLVLRFEQISFLHVLLLRPGNIYQNTFNNNEKKIKITDTEATTHTSSSLDLITAHWQFPGFHFTHTVFFFVFFLTRRYGFIQQQTSAHCCWAKDPGFMS